MANIDLPQIVIHSESSVNYTIQDVKWIPRSARVLVLGMYPNGSGVMQVYEMDHGNLNLTREMKAHVSQKCATFGASPIQCRHVATGNHEGYLSIWDLTDDAEPLYRVKAHEKGVIYSIDGVGGMCIGEGAPEIVTGGRDGLVKVWDPRQEKAVAEMSPNQGTACHECWTVAFGNVYSAEERCVAAGYANGDVKLFDFRTMALRWQTHVQNGVCCLEFDRKDIKMNKLAASTLEGCLYVWDLRTDHPTKSFPMLREKAHNCTAWMVRHLPSNREIFLTSGGTGNLFLWKYNYPETRVKKDADGKEYGVIGNIQPLHTTEMEQRHSTQAFHCFDWCPDKAGLAVAGSFDEKLRILIATKLNKL